MYSPAFTSLTIIHPYKRHTACLVVFSAIMEVLVATKITLPEPKLGSQRAKQLARVGVVQ
jgi:hypothetical protein